MAPHANRGCAAAPGPQRCTSDHGKVIATVFDEAALHNITRPMWKCDERQNILLVEGGPTGGCWRLCAKKWHIPVGQVKVCTPRDGPRQNSKQACGRCLPIYLAQLADGQIEKLALVVDADSPQWRFDRTLSQLQPCWPTVTKGLADKAARDSDLPMPTACLRWAPGSCAQQHRPRHGGRLVEKLPARR